jgi:hypothetical protein
MASITSITDEPNRALHSKNKHLYSYKNIKLHFIEKYQLKFTSANFAPSLYFTGRCSSAVHKSVLFPTRTITQSGSANS